jgi:hypothetical protein
MCSRAVKERQGKYILTCEELAGNDLYTGWNILGNLNKILYICVFGSIQLLASMLDYTTLDYITNSLVSLPRVLGFVFIRT